MFPDFATALHSKGPDPERASCLGLYSWLIGSWQMNGSIYRNEGEYRAEGEIHAGWVLAGRAIQDVWIFPGAFHGSTLRVYDPGLDAWHILWSDPLKQYYLRQLGRPRGKDIVQEGNSEQGVRTRWRFTEITPNSFHWIGERSGGGDAWQMEAEFFARRVPQGAAHSR